MPWTKQDKAAALCLLVELAARLEPVELFQCLHQIGAMASDRVDLVGEPDLLRKLPGLEACLERCMPEGSV